MSMQLLYIVTLSDSCKRGREGRGSSSTHGRQGPRLLSLTDKILSYIHSEWLYSIQSYGISLSSISGVSKAHDHIHSESVESQGNEFPADQHARHSEQ